MTKFTILINGSIVLNGDMTPMTFKNYVAAETFARQHFSYSPDVFSIVIQCGSKLNDNDYVQNSTQQQSCQG